MIFLRFMEVFLMVATVGLFILIVAVIKLEREKLEHDKEKDKHSGTMGR